MGSAAKQPRHEQGVTGKRAEAEGAWQQARGPQLAVTVHRKKIGVGKLKEGTGMGRVTEELGTGKVRGKLGRRQRGCQLAADRSRRAYLLGRSALKEAGIRCTPLGRSGSAARVRP